MVGTVHIVDVFERLIVFARCAHIHLSSNTMVPWACMSAYTANGISIVSAIFAGLMHHCVQHVHRQTQYVEASVAITRIYALGTCDAD